jgi:DNA gyrase subunit A
MIALTEGGLQPRLLTLKEILEEYITHREEVIRKRTEFELEKAQARAHILEGLKAALDKIDQIITTIRKSKDKDEAKANLISKFKFTELQAQAILEMRLQQLANLERQKIEDELKEKMKLIKELQSILKSKDKRMEIIKEDLAMLKDQYGDERRTQIVSGGVGEFSAKDLIPNESAIVVVTRDGYIKRLTSDTFKAQGRGGKGVAGMATREEDIISHFFSANTHSNLMFFTTSGRVFTLPAYEVPQASRTAKGQALVNFLQLAPHEKVSSIISLEDMAGYSYLVMSTRNGTIKKTAVEDFAHVRKSGLIALKLKSGDVLEWVKPTTGKDEISLVTFKGNSIRFEEAELRPMGRSAAGVRGIKLKEGDEVVGMDVIPAGSKDSDHNLCIIMENGYGKCTSLKEYKTQGRGGSGIKTANITGKTGNIVVARIIPDKAAEDGVIISEKGQVIRLKLKEVNKLGRATQGIRLMKFKNNDDRVSSMALLEEGNTSVEK